MTTREQLKEVLQTMPHVEEASVIGTWKLIATVVSEDFRGQNEAERQKAVLSFLRERLGSDEVDNIEFIFANTPEEQAAALLAS